MLCFHGVGKDPISKRQIPHNNAGELRAHIYLLDKGQYIHVAIVKIKLHDIYTYIYYLYKRYFMTIIRHISCILDICWTNLLFRFKAPWHDFPKTSVIIMKIWKRRHLIIRYYIDESSIPRCTLWFVSVCCDTHNIPAFFIAKISGT